MKQMKTIFTTGFAVLSLATFASNCPQLSGNFTIGASETSDFTTINQAVEALTCGGVAGPVIFGIETGNYKEKVNFSHVPGASALNTITFESKSGTNTDVVISYAATDATVVLNGTSYVSFENLTIDHSKGAYGNCMRIDGKSSNISFHGVVFDGVDVERTGGADATVLFTSTAAKSGIEFQDCEINNGSMGICKTGISSTEPDSKTSIIGTLFYNQYEAAIALSNEDAPRLTNNAFSSLSAYDKFKAVTLSDISNQMVVSNNIVNAVHGEAGVALNNCKAQLAGLGQITFNSITVGGQKTATGILMAGTSDNHVLNFNRVKLMMNEEQAGRQAYYKNTSVGKNINMMNNIFYDLNTGSYTIVGNTYKDVNNQLPSQSNPDMVISANGISVEKVEIIR